jgi:acyl-CoA synthetase (AMP-forming)/AMP-acid ligase II
MIRSLLSANETAKRDLSSMRALCAGGEASPVSLLDRVYAELPNIQFYNAYGLTESQGLVTVLGPEQKYRKLGSVGSVAWLREMRIVDDEDRVLPPGTPGEVVVRGPMVFSGYLHDEAATAAAIRGGWLHTGDVGYVDGDGYLYIVDRKKDMILSGGENIASSEVERVLDLHEAVDEVAVVGAPDERWGEVPVAFIVSRAGVEPEELSQFCQERLAKFKVPARFAFVDSLPRTATGKIVKTELREMALR